MEIICPQIEENEDGTLDIWPTLGPQVVDFMERKLVYGPGSLKGEPYIVRDEFRYLIYRLYEHFPEGHKVHYGKKAVDMSGRRRFQRGIVSLPKGSAKTELMAMLAIVEVHPDAPIRFNGYDPEAPGGMAPGRSVVSPYVPMLAPNIEQVKELAYGAAMEIVQDIDDSTLFDPTQARILVNGEADSMIKPVAATASRLDGGRPTFNCIDESHRLTEDRHIRSFETMKNNLPKRRADDPWQLTTTTAGDPAEVSVALAEYRLGMKIYEGKVEEPNTFFYHRQTSDENAKFETMEQRLTALEEASGPEAAAYRDLISVAKSWDDENADLAYLERVWCNRWVQSSQSAFDAKKFVELGDPSLKIPPGARITLGFDGALNDDSTALIATEIDTGIQNPFGIWERPEGVKNWTVPLGEVYSTVDQAYATYNVVFFYGDPPYWQQAMSDWSQKYGNTVVEWPTRNLNNMYYALRAYDEAINMGEVGHDGDKTFVEHIQNAGKNLQSQVDDEGKQKYRLAKKNRDKKIDASVAATISWQARLDAIADSEEDLYDDDYSHIPRKVR